MALRLAAAVLLSSAYLAVGALNPSTRANVQACCNKLTENVGPVYKIAGPGSNPQVLWPGHDDYDAINERWSATASLHPTCIFLPESAEDVQTALTLFVPGVVGVNSSCPFAIVGGGTAPAPGANDIDEGVVIDLSRMSRVSTSMNNTIVSIGAGATWPQVYDAINGTGRAIAGGDNTGAVGMALAGGINLYSSQSGMTADSVENFEVVLASGKIVNANRTSNSDLYRALKGGGNNYGVVTRMDMITLRGHDQLWGGELEVPINATGAVLSSLNSFVKNVGLDPYSGLRTTFSWNGTAQKGKITNFMWNTINTQASSLTPFFDLAPQIANTLQSNVPLNRMIPRQSSRHVDHRSLFATATVKNDNSTLFKVNQWTNTAIHNAEGLPDVDWRWSYDPLPKFYRMHGVNNMGLNYSRADLVVVSFNPHWIDPSFDLKITQVAKDWVHAIQYQTNVMNASYPFEYPGYAAPFQNPFASYGASNLRFYQETAKKYDPKGVFQTLVPGGFKVSKAGSKARQ